MSFLNRLRLLPATWLWTLSGLGLGVYAAFGCARFWLTDTLTQPTEKLLLWPASLLGGVLLAWLLGELTARLGNWSLGLSQAQARRQSAWLWAPWVLLGAGPLLSPLFLRLGGHLALEVLGKIQWPGHDGFVSLAPGVYLYLLWAGPWLTLPWFGLLGWGVWHRTRPSRTLAPTAYARWPVLLGLGFLFYLGLGLWTTTVYPPTGDEPHYLLMTHSLVHDRDLDLTDNMAQRDYRHFYPGESLDFHGVPTLGGKLISKHFPLLSGLLAPGYALLGRFGAAWLVMLAAAGLAVVVHQFLRGLKVSPAAALAVWALMLASPPLGTYFDLIYTELPASLVLGLGVLAWQKSGTGGLLGVLAAALALPWFYPKYIPLALILGLAAFWIPRRNFRLLAGGALGALLSGWLYVSVFVSLYGGQLTQGHYGEFHPFFSRDTLDHALGLILDRDFGLAAVSPVLLLGLLGVFSGPVEIKKTRRFIGGLFVVEYLFMSLFVDFTGSSSVFSRNALPGAVLLFVLVPAGWERLERFGRKRILLTALLAGAGVGLTWLCTALPVLRYLAPKLKLWQALKITPSLFPSFTQTIGPGTYLWGAVWLGVLGGFFYLTRRRGIRP
ncbi:MAG: hypothetical protein HGA76_11285 [Candidatus Firestonebacteria bacterium]|nr:hypothetical protein [Candidatus Firestonebacteria bacterium]